MDAAVIVLAAGESKRFGGFKLLADYCGEPLVVRAIRSAVAADVGPVYVVVGHRAEELRAAVKSAGLDVYFVHNPWYRLGLSASLKAALIAAPFFKSYVIALGDMPLVRPETYKELLAHIDKADVVYPTFRGARGNPVAISRRVLPYALWIEGDVGIRAVLDRVKALGVEVEDPGVLIDVDREEDVACG